MTAASVLLPLSLRHVRHVRHVAIPALAQDGAARVRHVRHVHSRGYGGKSGALSDGAKGVES